MDSKYESFMIDNDLSLLKENGEKLLEKYNKPENFDQLSKAQNNVNNIKVDVQKNIDMMIENNGELEHLEDQAKDMEDNADQFNHNAKSLEREMFWKKVRYTAIIIGIVLVLVLIIVLSVVLSR